LDIESFVDFLDGSCPPTAAAVVDVVVFGIINIQKIDAVDVKSIADHRNDDNDMISFLSLFSFPCVLLPEVV
jgi:hypothetical protein